jgi:hypothetical protein
MQSPFSSLVFFPFVIFSIKSVGDKYGGRKMSDEEFMIIPLNMIDYDPRARDGTWCKLPYPNHPKGCPNFPECPRKYTDYNELPEKEWYAIVIKFDLQAHAEEMMKKDWCKTWRQARCVLYWQSSIRKKLRDKASEFANPLNGDIILEIPEASGINVYTTMAKHGLTLKPINMDLGTVYKIVLVGKTLESDFWW